MRFIIPAALAAVFSCGAAQAATDPLFAGAVHAKPAKLVHVPGKLAVNFTVNFEGGTFVFPGQLTLKKGVLGGTVTAPSGCVATVDSGSTDKKNKLNLNVTFGGICAGEPGSFVGTLKFKAGTGAGTFTDPYASGPYSAAHG